MSFIVDLEDKLLGRELERLLSQASRAEDPQNYIVLIYDTLAQKKRIEAEVQSRSELDAIIQIPVYLGVDIPLPLSFHVLEQFIHNAYLKQSLDNEARFEVVEGLYVDCYARQLCLTEAQKQKTLGLTEKEVRLFQILSREPGQLVARKIILQEVWGYREGIESHTLETHIYRLRQKLADFLGKGGEDLIVTEAGGYAIDQTLHFD